MNFNWEAISAISNIILSILTLVALMLTLHTVRVNNISKGKLDFRSEKGVFSDRYKLKFVNQRNVPITIIYVGFFIQTPDRRELILKGESSQKKLQWTDTIYFTVYHKDINELLIKQGFNDGDKVKVFGFIKTSSNKLYKKKFLHLVHNEEYYEIKPVLKD